MPRPLISTHGSSIAMRYLFSTRVNVLSSGISIGGNPSEIWPYLQHNVLFFVMFINNISPVLFEVGPLEVRYYGVFFALGALLYYLVTRWIFRREKFSVGDLDDVAVFLFLGMVVGARLGHAVFYNFSYYLGDPVAILKVWEGGLSSHGAAIGLLVAYLIYYFWKKPPKRYADALVVAMPLVAGFVRLGNFFNSEIVGRETTLPWGVSFTQRGEDFARHPSQLYEMLLLWGIFVVLLVFYRKLKLYSVIFLFVGIYFAGRFFLEFFKEYMVFGEGLTMGQWLSLIPVILVGIYFLFGTINTMKKIIVFVLFVICLVFLVMRGSGGIWFDDIEDRISYSDEEKEAVVDYILGEEIVDFEGVRIVFVSVSDGQNKAQVYMGVGDSLIAALDDAGAFVDEGEWFKVDLVTEVFDEKEIEFERSLYGVAFKEETAFIAEEIVANTLFNSDNEIKYSNIEDYQIEQGDTPNTSALKWSKIHYFTTESFFFDKTGEIVDLYRGHPIFEELTDELLLVAASGAGNYLEAAVREDGSFVYDYLPKTDEESDSYNILRHAGTIYAMMELYEVTGDEELYEAGERALEYLVDQIEDCSGGLCVVEDDEVKLGGNGLAIIALVEYMNASGDYSYLSTAQDLADWILSVQGEDGEFEIHKMEYSTEEDTGFISGYYPGEAILALNRLYSVDGDEGWLDAAEAAAGYLINVRDAGVSLASLDHDHWLLYGLNELYRYRPDEIYIEHAFKIVDAIDNLQRQEAGDFPLDWLGSYYTPPRSTPTATRSEGLMAAYQLASDYGYEEEAAHILEMVELGVRFDLGTQFGPWLAMYVHDPERVLGGFHEDLTDYSIRIDYVQHNISALLLVRNQ